MQSLLIQELADTIACPACGVALVLLEAKDVECGRCRERFRWLGQTWEFIPARCRESSELWATWDCLQANGLVSYREDPEHNLAVGDRRDCLEFSEFCRFDGLVLDVGCGPQPWPAYFQLHSTGTRFVGVDPLIEEPTGQYLQLRAVGEYLPFRSSVFDHVVFATSLDHVVDPMRAVTEARRVCRQGGEIDVWIGEKSPSAPPLAASPAWYLQLQKPAEAQDVFHLKRLGLSDVEALINEASLRRIDHQVRRLDETRTNHFFRLRAPE